MAKVFQCKYCKCTFPSMQGQHSHLAQAKKCHKMWEADLDTIHTSLPQNFNGCGEDNNQSTEIGKQSPVTDRLKKYKLTINPLRYTSWWRCCPRRGWSSAQFSWWRQRSQNATIQCLMARKLPLSSRAGLTQRTYHVQNSAQCSSHQRGINMGEILRQGWLECRTVDTGLWNDPCSYKQASETREG